MNMTAHIEEYYSYQQAVADEEACQAEEAAWSNYFERDNSPEAWAEYDRERRYAFWCR